MESKTPNSFVTTLDLQLADRLLSDLKAKNFDISIPPYTRFSAKKKGLSCTLFNSGKLVVQGKECSEFVEFYLEPEILKSFEFSHPLAHKDVSPHIGIDESGKGDFFGPLCVAGVYVKEDQFPILQSIGVKDSKTINDTKIKIIAAEIRNICQYHIIKINPQKYNQIYVEFKNLNRLLAWGHATAIEKLVEQTGCTHVIIDQFADESVVETALKRKKLKVNLSQRHRAEEDLAVAAASILARDAFVQGLDQLGKELGIKLTKGASQETQRTGQEILRKFGKEKLLTVCKKHFKTLDIILLKAGQLNFEH